MNDWSSQRFSFQQRLSLLLLVFILTSCASVASSTSNNTNTSTRANSTGATQDLQPAYNYDKSQTIAGLVIKLDGFICTEGPFLSNLTIATSQLSYDAGSVQIIQNYLQLLADNANINPPAHPLVTWIPPQPPKELQWVPGSTKCTGNLAITNTTHTSIEIEHFGMQLTTAATTNSYHYQQVSLKSRCIECGGVPPCAYTVSMTLDGGQSGSYFDSPITSTNSIQCPLPIMMPPSGSAELSITFQDAYTRDMIYTGTPAFDSKASAGEQRLMLSAFTSSLSFTHTDKLPCYQFQGDTFAPCSQS